MKISWVSIHNYQNKIYPHDIIMDIIQNLSDTNCKYLKVNVDEHKYKGNLDSDSPESIARAMFQKGFKKFRGQLISSKSKIFT